jgi:hypothetical protein
MIHSVGEILCLTATRRNGPFLVRRPHARPIDRRRVRLRTRRHPLPRHRVIDARGHLIRQFALAGRLTTFHLDGLTTDECLWRTPKSALRGVARCSAGIIRSAPQFGA